MSLPDRHTVWRVFDVIHLIQAGTYPNPRSIAERFECSVRTAERYVEKLRDFVAEDLVYDRERKDRKSVV